MTDSSTRSHSCASYVLLPVFTITRNCLVLYRATARAITQQLSIVSLTDAILPLVLVVHLWYHPTTLSTRYTNYRSVVLVFTRTSQPPACLICLP